MPAQYPLWFLTEGVRRKLEEMAAHWQAPPPQG
jgi:hypothetical protein